jgi:MFS family permease
LAIDLGPLRRHRDFRLYAISRGVSFFGSMITFVAVPYQVFNLTRSSLAVGLLGAVELACLLSLALVGGALADAIDRRRLILGAEAVLAVCSIVLLINASLPHARVWLIFVVAGVMAALGGIQRPAIDALIPRLVDRDEVMAANAIGLLESTAGMIVGPAVAGVLLAGGGLTFTFGVDLVTFALSLLALGAMNAVPRPDDAERPSVRRILDGLRYARSRPELIGTYVVDMAAMFFGMPMALFPAIAHRYGGAEALGALYAAPSVGAFLATLTSGWTVRVHHQGRAILVAATAWGMAIVIFGVAPSLGIAFVGLALAGAADMVSGIFRLTIWNRTIPDSFRGRLASIEMVSYSTGPLLGNTESGVVATFIGVGPAVVSGGLCCIAAVLVTAAALPALRWYDDRADPRLEATESET